MNLKEQKKLMSSQLLKLIKDKVTPESIRIEVEGDSQPD
jgi:hypothetical protein